MSARSNLLVILTVCVLGVVVLLGRPERFAEAQRWAGHWEPVFYKAKPAGTPRAASKELPWHIVVSNKRVGFIVNARRQIILHVSESASPQDCADLLRQYGNGLPRKSITIVKKLNSEAKMTPWCIDNHDGTDIVFFNLVPSEERQANPLPLPDHHVASNDRIGLSTDARRRLTIHATGNFSRRQCVNLLKRYSKSMAPRSQVIVKRRNFNGDMKPWCIDNLDGAKVMFVDFLFDPKDPVNRMTE